MKHQMELDRRSTTSTQPFEDVLLPMHPAMGHYLLDLIARDLRGMSGLRSTEWQESIASFALFLSDQLPEEFRVPVPSVG